MAPTKAITQRMVLKKDKLKIWVKAMTIIVPMVINKTFNEYLKYINPTKIAAKAHKIPAT